MVVWMAKEFDDAGIGTLFDSEEKALVEAEKILRAILPEGEIEDMVADGEWGSVANMIANDGAYEFAYVAEIEVK